MSKYRIISTALFFALNMCMADVICDFESGTLALMTSTSATTPTVVTGSGGMAPVSGNYFAHFSNAWNDEVAKYTFSTAAQGTLSGYLYMAELPATANRWASVLLTSSTSSRFYLVANYVNGEIGYANGSVNTYTYVKIADVNINQWYSFAISVGDSGITSLTWNETPVTVYGGSGFTDVQSFSIGGPVGSCESGYDDLRFVVPEPAVTAFFLLGSGFVYIRKKKKQDLI